MHPIIPQIIGILAVASFLLSYQLKNRKSIIILNTVARCLYILQYVLIGAFTGAVVDVLGAVACIVASKKDVPFIKKHLPWVIIAVNLSILVSGLAVYEAPIDLLPIAGVLIQTGALWLSNEQTIRKISLIGSPCWFTYNLCFKAYGPAAGDLMTAASIIIAIIKYRKASKTEDKNV